ncbi:MAG: homoserine dehydrogenase [Alphaproteobacteria bacterium]
MNHVNVAIAGLGTVGVGTIDILQRQYNKIQDKLGVSLQIVAVCARSKRDRGIDLSGYDYVEDVLSLATREDVDIFVELIGGADGIALQATKLALAHGKHVVTANKAMIAEHGFELASLAEKNGVNLRFEAAVAGGIPILKVLQEGLIGNEVRKISGILNGTCNYILSAMSEESTEFSVMLQRAQDAGYAEADPSFDIDGIDAAHKIAILAALAFGTKPNFAAVSVSGIRDICIDDINYARELGFRVKLLAVAEMVNEKLQQRVSLALVPADEPLAAVDDVFNAVLVDAQPVGHVMIDGRGAGAGPTGSAVVADIADVARGAKLPVFGKPSQHLREALEVGEDIGTGAFYVRLLVRDEPGVLAAITKIFAENHISIDSVIQKNRAPGEYVPLVLLTHEASRVALFKVTNKIAEQSVVLEQPVVMEIQRP